MPLVRIVVHDDSETYIHSSYDLNLIDLIKSMPSRTWSKPDRAWIIRTRDLEDLTDALEQDGYEYVVTDRRKTEPKGDDTKSSQWSANEDAAWARNRGGGDDWAFQMFQAVGPDLAAKVHKALARVLHPDMGGSSELMKQVNVAAERAKTVHR